MRTRPGRLIAATLLALAAADAAAELEVHYTSYSPITVARNSEVYVRLDDEGLVRYMEEHVYESEGRHRLLGEDTRPLSLFLTTTVTDTPDGLRVERTRPDGTLEETITCTFLDERRLRVVTGHGASELEIGGRNGESTAHLADGAVVSWRRSGSSVVVTGLRPEGITESYRWGTDDHLYTKIRAFDEHRLEAHATYDRAADMVIVEIPGPDGLSPFDWRYDVHDARALLDYEFSPLAATLNVTLLGGRGFDGWRLFPLFAINELGE